MSTNGPSNDEVESIDAAMGGDMSPARSQSSVPDTDRVGYEEMVARAAEYLREGLCEISQIKPKEYHEASDEQFLDDVKERLEQTTSTDEDQETVKESDAQTVDWDALWAEFGFDEPDALGNEYISNTQLTAALECTSQACPSGGDVIGEAVEDGELQRLTIAGTDGEMGTRGFVRTQGGQL